jgi:hypothetical protein
VCTQIKCEPLEDHLAPPAQSAGAFAGHCPPRSLGVPCEWTRRRGEVDAPSHQAMNRKMRPIFQSCLETNESPCETIDQGRHILRRDLIQGVA